MKNKITKVLKRVVFAFGVLYGINIILKNVGVYIPINYITLSVTTFLGVPGVLSLFALLFIVK